MRKLIGGALVAVVGLGLPLGAWGVERRMAQGEAQGDRMTTISQRELDYLHQRVGQLELQNAQLRAELQRARPNELGVGGAGAAGRAPSASGELVGIVQNVSPGQIRVVDSFGTAYDLRISARTEARERNQPVPLDHLRQGEQVRARFNLSNGVTYAQRLEILPPQRQGQRPPAPSRAPAAPPPVRK